MPKHIPRKGILFSRTYFIEVIFPSIPLSPKPGATNTASTSFNSSFTVVSFTFSALILITFTLHSFIVPA